jgi:hypothetical protein
MEAYDIIAIAMSSLLMLIVLHLSVFGVIRWMYPLPPPQVRFVEPSFTQPAEPKQVINVPTYEKPVPVEAPREEGLPDYTAKAPSTATERPSWLVAVDPKTLE